MKNIKDTKKGDLFLLAIGLLAVVAMIGVYLNNGPAQGRESDQRIAVITRDGNKVAELDLNEIEEPRYYTLDDGIHVKIVAENGSIRFQEADCPDKICIKTGTLTEPGQQAICMPSKTIVRILDE